MPDPDKRGRAKSRSISWNDTYRPVYRSPKSTAQRWLTRAQSRKAAVSSNPYATYGDRWYARQDAAMAAQAAAVECDLHRTMAKMQLNMAMFSATSSMMLGLSDKLAAIEEAKTQTQAKVDAYTYSARANAVRRLQDGVLQHGRWFVRPFSWEDGIGLLLVDTDTGQWREIIISPDEGGLATRFVNVPLARITRDGKRLITHGIGLYPETWEKDNRYPQFQTVYRSVQAFDLEGVKLRPKEKYPALSVVTLSKEK